ncbi:MAG: hypothetical protein WKF96_01125 [Solirubrobacteraceae bacterium]
MRHLLSALDLARDTVEQLIATARGFATGAIFAPQLGGIAALAFFEDSLRTRVGFEVAALRLGMGSTTVSGERHGERMSAPESLSDTARTLGAYCDVLCLRHPQADAPRIASRVAGVPVVNCGNGLDEHPSQALIDLFAIQDARGQIDGVRVAVVGDLQHMRAAHSLLIALGRFDDVTVRCVAPAGLGMPDRYLEQSAVAASQTTELRIEDVDIVYMAGLPPRSPSGEVGDEVRARYAIDAARANAMTPGARILCPMPRIDEIGAEVDELEQAGYVRQSELGLAMRMAILHRAIDRA